MRPLGPFKGSTFREPAWRGAFRTCPYSRSATAPSNKYPGALATPPLLCSTTRGQCSRPERQAELRKAATLNAPRHNKQTEEEDRQQWGGLRAARRWASRRGRGRRRRTRSSSPTSSASATATGARCPSKPVSLLPVPAAAATCLLAQLAS